MKKQLCVALIGAIMSIMLITLSACNAYVSHYSAIALVSTNTSNPASMSFASFKGSMVFNLRCKNENDKIEYSSQLEEGSAVVYYDWNGVKTELFYINSNEYIQSSNETLKKGSFHIIIEIPDGAKNGKFSFDIK